MSSQNSCHPVAYRENGVRGRRGTGRKLRIMAEGWDASASGVLRLPSGRLIRGRGSAFTLRRVRHPTSGSPCRTQGQPRSLGRRVGSVGRISACPATVVTLLTHYAKRRFDLKMSGWRSPVRAGRGRTGTALACIAALDGVPTEPAVAFVREHYAPMRSRRRGSVGTWPPILGGVTPSRRRIGLRTALWDDRPHDPDIRCIRPAGQ